MSMRLVIGGPTRDTVPAAFAMDLARLLAYTQRWDGGDVTLRFVTATYVHAGREAVLEAAIEYGADHVLWLDTDMTFPQDTALRLAAFDRPIVACNCVLRDPRIIFTAQRHGRRIETRQESTGLQQVDTVGMAVMLMRTDVVATLPRPWFRHEWQTSRQQDRGEDVVFCEALREAGHAIYIDHDLSKEIGHVGQCTYRPIGVAPVPV